MEHTRKLRSAFFSALLLFIGVLSLTVHFEIYHRTSASAFINQPVFYYNRFYIRDSDGHTVDVSLQIGSWSYITAALAVASLSWGATRVVVAAKKRLTAKRGGAPDRGRPVAAP
jgi:hypothetical protein